MQDSKWKIFLLTETLERNLGVYNLIIKLNSNQGTWVNISTFIVSAEGCTVTTSGQGFRFAFQ